jgi:hypothetical protein
MQLLKSILILVRYNSQENFINLYLKNIPHKVKIVDKNCCLMKIINLTCLTQVFMSENHFMVQWVLNINFNVNVLDMILHIQDI